MPLPTPTPPPPLNKIQANNCGNIQAILIKIKVHLVQFGQNWVKLWQEAKKEQIEMITLFSRFGFISNVVKMPHRSTLFFINLFHFHFGTLFHYFKFHTDIFRFLCSLFFSVFLPPPFLLLARGGGDTCMPLFPPPPPI